MTKFRLKKGNTSHDFKELTGPGSVEQFKNLHPDWADVVPEPYEELPTPEPAKDELQIVKENIAKGEAMILDYLADNRRLRLTNEQSLQQLAKFQVIKALLQVGDLSSAKALLSVTEVDEIFTQERKDKYLSML